MLWMAIILKCQRCLTIWTYSGKNKFVTSCSSCKTSVSIKKNMIPSDSVGRPEGKTESKAHPNTTLRRLRNHKYNSNFQRRGF